MPGNDFRPHNSSMSDDILRSLQTVVGQQATILQGQQQMLSRQESRLDAMQEQLGMLTEVATKLAVMEERRGEDKQALGKLEDRFNLLQNRVIANFPQYDGLVETYKTVNNRLWAAIGVSLMGLIIGAVKLGLITGT